MDVKTRIGLKIYEQRVKRGISQEALADLLGVSRQTVSKWELAKAAPDIIKIVELSKLWNITTDELLLEKAPDLLMPSEHILNWGIYLIVNDVNKSILFYEKLLNRKSTIIGAGRFAQFKFNGNCILSIINKRHLKNYDLESAKHGKIVLNLWTTDLGKEFSRIKKINIGPFTEITSFHPTYHYFTLVDPDYNLIEITGEFFESGILE
ncbi:MAG: helix-turn-helix domain-containing protein [Erysipelotrichales bacterium]|nr:helix-turn-helix domain-containing protein [Erysipelotrichales bacterium]